MSGASRGAKAVAHEPTHADVEAQVHAVLDTLDGGRGARDAVVIPIPAETTDAVPEVRSTVRDILETALPPDLQREAQLICSELVTNALAHGDPPVRLLLHETPDDVIVAVFDRSAAMPVPTDSNTSGLRIVESLSEHRWGVAKPNGGKWVWAAIPRRGHHDH